MDLRWIKSLTGRSYPASADGRVGDRCSRVRRYSVGGTWFGPLGAVEGGFGRDGGTGDPPTGRVGSVRSRVNKPLSSLRILLVACATASLTATATFAQDTNYTSVEATPDKPVQLSYHASAHKSNCSPARLPTIRVIEPPKSGLLTVRKAVLTTDKIAGCPHLKTPAQVMFYAAHAGYVGPDHVKYEITSENGEVATYDVTIDVKAAPAQTPPAGPAGAEKL
jgi:hypothetical protein